MQKIIWRLFCVLTMFGMVETLCAQGTAFTYQGRLAVGGNPATGNYDLRFQIYDAVTNGNAVSFPLTNAAVVVNNGLFTTTIDFGVGIFTGPNRWLDISVQTNGMTNAFVVLSPRQPVLPVPYAILANSASNLLGTLPAAQLSGTLPASAFAGYTNTVALTNGANLFSGTFNGTFIGNGTNLVNLNASQLTGGTMADARLSGNVALLNANQTFTGTNNFSGPSNNFTGIFTGNGTNLVNLNASQLTGGTLPDARLSTNVPLLNTNQTFTSSNTFTGFNTFTGTNTFTGVNTFTNFGNSFRGSFFGNGLVGWLVQTGTTVLAVIDTGYVLTNSQLVTIALPTNVNIGDIVRISGPGSGGWKISQNATQSVVGNFSGYTNSYWTVSGASAAKWISIASSSDGNKLVAAADDAGIYNSANAGVTWSQGSGLPVGEAVASSADGTKLVSAYNKGGLGGGIYTSTDSGGSWVNTGPGNADWYSVASSADGTKLVAVISNNVSGGIYVSASSGQLGSWLLQSTAARWISVSSSADGTKLVAAQFGGGIFTNSGSTWANSSASIGAKNWVSVASSADGSKLAAAVSGGGIYISTDFGRTWLPSGATSQNWSCIASSADGGKLAATVFNGGIYLSSDFGATWTQQVNTPVANWQAIAASSDGTKLAAGINSASTLPVGIYLLHASMKAATTTGTSGYISGGQGTAVELQYTGNGQFMPVSSAGTIWAN